VLLFLCVLQEFDPEFEEDGSEAGSDVDFSGTATDTPQQLSPAVAAAAAAAAPELISCHVTTRTKQLTKHCITLMLPTPTPT